MPGCDIDNAAIYERRAGAAVSGIEAPENLPSRPVERPQMAIGAEARVAGSACHSWNSGGGPAYRAAMEFPQQAAIGGIERPQGSARSYQHTGTKNERRSLNPLRNSKRPV